MIFRSSKHVQKRFWPAAEVAADPQLSRLDSALTIGGRQYYDRLLEETAFLLSGCGAVSSSLEGRRR